MTETAPSPTAQTLARLAAEVWDASMAAFPLYATSLGDRRHLTQLSPNDAGAEDREAARVREALAAERVAPLVARPAFLSGESQAVGNERLQRSARSTTRGAHDDF